MKDRFTRFLRAQTMRQEKLKGHSIVRESETENDMEKIEVGEHQEPLCCQLRGKTVYEYVVDEMDGDVEEDVRGEFANHLQQCTICFGTFLRLQRILDVVTRSGELLSNARAPSRLELVRRKGMKWESRSGIN